MEIMNTLFQVSDTVGFDDHIEDFPLDEGTVLSIKPEDRDHGTDECIVVQVGPNVLGIYRAEQLVRLHSIGREESRG
jgi:hypothetical protein